MQVMKLVTAKRKRQGKWICVGCRMLITVTWDAGVWYSNRYTKSIFMSCNPEFGRFTRCTFKQSWIWWGKEIQNRECVWIKILLLRFPRHLQLGNRAYSSNHWQKLLSVRNIIKRPYCWLSVHLQSYFTSRDSAGERINTHTQIHSPSQVPKAQTPSHTVCHSQ